MEINSSRAANFGAAKFRIDGRGAQNAGGSMLRGLNLVVWLSKASTKVSAEKGHIYCLNRLVEIS